MKKAVIVASGGMDSATLAWYYHSKGYQLILVGFDYGQRHKKELEYLKRIGDRLESEVKIVDLANLSSSLHGSSLTSSDVAVPDGHYAEETMKATVVPNRNAIMLSIATGIAVAEGANLVATGVHAGDHYIYPDCRPAFIDALGIAFKVGTDGHAPDDFALVAPFVEISKADIATLGRELGVDYSLTWSCYKGGLTHCGRCGTCVERIEAFMESGQEDPTIYEDGIEFALEEILKRTNA
jgi:7-cyano-7-deazaguanine synthase